METSDRLELSLRDDTPVVARSLIPDDRPALAEAYRRLSPEARYNRFWTHTGEVIGEKMLSRVLAQDPATHVTWTVLDLCREFSPLAGASWWRDADHPAEAEISLIVLDAEQGRGIGTLLLALMWLTAFRAGVEVMMIGDQGSEIGNSLPRGSGGHGRLRSSGKPPGRRLDARLRRDRRMGRLQADLPLETERP